MESDRKLSIRLHFPPINTANGNKESFYTYNFSGLGLKVGMRGILFPSI